MRCAVQYDVRGRLRGVFEKALLSSEKEHQHLEFLLLPFYCLKYVDDWNCPLHVATMECQART